MNSAHLYTVIIKVYEAQEVSVDQVRIEATHLDEIFFAWVEQAVARGFIKGTDDPKVPFRDIMVRNKHLEALDGVFNIWRIEFLIGKDFYVKDVIRARHGGIFELNESIYVTIDFIKTSMSESSMILSTEDVLGPTDSHYVRHAEEKYASYLERHERLKGVAALSRSITQERRRVEKQLIYWDVKRRFHSQFYNRDATLEEATMHTIVMYYRGGTYLRQFIDILSNDLKLVLLIWAHDVFRDMYESKIIAPQDRVILMDKVSQYIHTPVPIDEYTNVWGTYFSLSEGMAKIVIVKTALDEVVQGSIRTSGALTSV